MEKFKKIDSCIALLEELSENADLLAEVPFEKGNAVLVEKVSRLHTTRASRRGIQNHLSRHLCLLAISFL